MMDLITLEVIKNALSSIADEMALVLMRSAYSPVVRDSMDYSTALCDRHGQVIAQGLTLAVQLGAFPDAMQHLTQKYKGKMQPGDIFIMNDPYGYGGKAVRPYLEAIMDQAERLMREFIRGIPDGEYRFTDWIDGIGETPEPLKIAVCVSVRGDEIEVDFTGTSAQVQGAINCPIAMARSSAYCAIRCVTSPDIPNCEGYMRPVRFKAPEGTILNPVLPAACAARGVMGYRVFDAIMGALSQVVPQRVIAAGEGGPTLFSVGGYADGRPFVLTEVMVGTWGARAGKDGVEGISNPAANLSNQPVELIEAELPLEVLRYGMVQDSGGAGEYRGGLAFVREFRLTADEAVFTTRADRRDHLPYGFSDAQSGSGSRHTLISGKTERALPTMPMEAIKWRAGDVFRHVSAGGGGYGDPLARDPALVLADVLDEKVSINAARELYGVVVKGGAIDAAATRRLRAKAKAA